MKNHKLARNYRFPMNLIEKLKEVSDEIGCSNTFVIEQALKRFFEEYENLGYVPEISERKLSFRILKNRN
jgi:predicted DNA-binding protein